MATCDIFGFKHDDLSAARTSVEAALPLTLESRGEDDGQGGPFFVNESCEGPLVQLRLNWGPYKRWSGDPPEIWHPEFGVLVFVYGENRESTVRRLKRYGGGATFLETVERM